MSYEIRFFHPWRPIEITARTIQGRALLKPSPRVNAIIAGIIARAKEQYGVEIYGFSFLSNHYHMLIAASHVSKVSKFMGYINSNIGKEMCREFKWSSKLWHRRYRGIPVLDEDALMQRMRYIMSNGVKERLAAHPRDWYGLNSYQALAHGRNVQGIWIDRTSLGRARRTRSGMNAREEDFTTHYELIVDPLPHLTHLTKSTRQSLYRDMGEEVAQEHESLRKQENTKIRKKKAILGQNPHKPRPLPKKRTAPFCHTTDPALRLDFKQAYQTFVEALRAAGHQLFLAARSTLGYPENGLLPGYL